MVIASAHESDPRSYRVIRDPVHDYVQLPIALNALVDHPLLQRLRRIGQTALSSSVFPSMTGSRFEHALGTMHLALQAWDSLWSRALPATREAFRSDVFRHLQNRKKLLDSYSQEWIKDADVFHAKFGANVRLAVGTAALLHDVGHSPFSHALEGFYERNLALILTDGLHVAFDEVIETLKPHAGSAPAAFHERVGDHLLDQIQPATVASIPWFVVTEILRAEGGWAGALHDIVASDVDVDRLDYLQRDAGRAGTEFGSIDRQRLVDSLELHSVRLEEAESWKLGYGYRARTAIETLLSNRLRYYQWVLFHPHVAAANKFLDLALQDLVEVAKVAASVGSTQADIAAATAIDQVRPDLNYIDPRPQSARRQIRLGRSASALQDPMAQLRQSEVDDSTVTQWLKAAASASRALLGSKEITSGLQGRLRRFLALYEAGLFRSPNWAPVWKTEDQYAEIATDLQPALLSMLRAQREDAADAAKRMLQDMGDDSTEQINGRTQFGASEERLAQRIYEGLIARLDADPVDGLNGLAHHLLARQQPHVRLSRELALAEQLGRTAPPISGITDGFWVFVYDRVLAMKEDDSGIVVWRAQQHIPLKTISSMVAALPEVARSFPQMFAYYMVPGNTEVRVGRESQHAPDLRRAFVAGFAGAADVVLRHGA